MARRVTFLIDDGLERRVRGYQARKMLERNKACSYSDAVNDLLAGGA